VLVDLKQDLSAVSVLVLTGFRFVLNALVPLLGTHGRFSSSDGRQHQERLQC